MPTFLITTHTNTDRHQRILDELHYADWTDFECMAILATDWRLFTYAGLTETEAKHQSLTLAYRQCAQTALLFNIDYYLVIEDDLHVIDPFELRSNIDNLPEPFDLCYLTRTEHNRLSGYTKSHCNHFEQVIAHWWETPITAWSKRFAQRFEDHISHKLTEKLWLGHIDHELLKLNQGFHFGSIHKTAVGLSTEPEYHLNNLKSSIT